MRRRLTDRRFGCRPRTATGTKTLYTFRIVPESRCAQAQPVSCKRLLCGRRAYGELEVVGGQVQALAFVEAMRILALNP